VYSHVTTFTLVCHEQIREGCLSLDSEETANIGTGMINGTFDLWLWYGMVPCLDDKKLKRRAIWSNTLEKNID
jgi:hypothetical protein